MKTSDIVNTFETIVPNPKCPLNYNKDYELLIAVMLSAQTTDDRVNAVTQELFKYSLEELAELSISKIEGIIKPVGTQKRKANYVHKIANIISNECNGIVPHDRVFIESLPGVGHKTCNVVFSELFDEPAFAVDTHVARVSKRLGFVKDDDDVQIIESKLCKKFPKDKWSRLHVQFVLFGRHTCTSRNPKCDKCPFKFTQCKRPQI